MNIERNTVTGFHYSSSMPVTAQTIISMGTTAGEVGQIKKTFITDLKMSTSTTATVKIYADNYEGTGEVNPLEFDLPVNTVTNFNWEMPYEMFVIGTSGESRNIVASASAVGVKYSISGYIERG